MPKRDGEFGLDVTQRRMLEEELLRQTAESEAASIARSEFLANISHEIRNPLTSIIGFAGLLGHAQELSPKSRSYIERINKSGRALLAVVEDILDFSKLEAGQIRLDPHAFAPAALVRETLDHVAEQASAKGLMMVIEASALPLSLRADSARLRQILLNLLVNAIKFSQAGPVEVKVSYEQAEGGRLRMAVADTGEGVAAGLNYRPLQPLSQVDGSNYGRPGSIGLGLAICKGLVDLMGGEIGVESREAQGPTFWFEIPAPPAEPADEPGPPHPVDAASMRRAEILVADDVADNRELVRAMLEALGHAVEEACDGIEAVDAALRTRFDLILMDMDMPGMDGLAATREIRARSILNNRTPVVALTANVMGAQIAACLEAGMNDHLAKPIAPVKLVQAIARWIDMDREARPSVPDDLEAS